MAMMFFSLQVRSSAPQLRPPSAARSEQACCAGTLAKPSPAQAPRHEVSSLEEESPVPGRGGGDTASLSQPALQVSIHNLQQRRGWAARRREPAASVGAAPGGCSLGSCSTPSPASRQDGAVCMGWRPSEASPGAGAQWDRLGLSARPRRLLEPASPWATWLSLPPAREAAAPGPAPPSRPAAGRRSRARSNQRERTESVVPSSLAPGPAFGLLKASLQRCQFSLIPASKPELPNSQERSCRLPKRRRGRGRRRGKLCGEARSRAARGRASAAAWGPGAGGGAPALRLLHAKPPGRRTAGLRREGARNLPDRGTPFCSTAAPRTRRHGTQILQGSTKKEDEEVLPHAGGRYLPRWGPLRPAVPARPRFPAPLCCGSASLRRANQVNAFLTWHRKSLCFLSDSFFSLVSL